MCEKCIEHIKCPVGEKRRIEVSGEAYEVIDFYGRTHHIEPWVMVVDKYPDHTDAFIYRRAYDENSVQYGGGLHITHCPFCGERLVMSDG